jgi:peroxisomal 2,4-dienoyl-CoA reductase
MSDSPSSGSVDGSAGSGNAASARPGPRDPLFPRDLLEGKVALVTGGGTGVGFGIAGCLLRYGADVCIASRTLERLEEAADELEGEHGGTVLPLETDVREADVIRATVDRAADELGGLDVLVNNAAGNFYCPSDELSPGGWSAVVETDLYGSFYAAQAAFPHMRDAGWGRIVSISMTLHYRGWPKMAHATAAKAGVDGLTRTLAQEWGGHGINVNAVAPGPIPTEGVREAFEGPGEDVPDLFGGGDDDGDGRAGGADGEGGGPTPDVPRAARAYAKRAVPAGRLGRPGDVGHMVTYLCSPGGDWITGAILVVDGGENLTKVGMRPGG